MGTEAFKRICEENTHLDCKRKMAREQMLQDISINQWGHKHEVTYLRPENQSECVEVRDGVDTCMLEAAEKFCGRLDPPPGDCVMMVGNAIKSGLEVYEDKLRWDGKDHYRSLELTRDVSNGTVRKRYKKLVKE